MKYLVLLACMSAFALQAQTTFVKKYHNAVDKRYNRGKMSIFHTGSGWIYKDLDRIEYNYEYKLLQKAGKTTMVDVKIMKSVLPFVYFITRLLTVLMF
jgi:hypothetical protein